MKGNSVVNNNNTRLYSILQVPTAATLFEIKNAYKKLALKYHPDKNNHSEESKLKFQEICKAYEVLHDKDKKLLYDTYGTLDESLIDKQRGNNDQKDDFDTTELSPGDLFAKFFDKSSRVNNNNYNSNSSPFNNVPSTNTNTNSAGNRFMTQALNSPSTTGTLFEKGLSRGPDIKHVLNCTLKELYQGKKCKLGLNRTRSCHSCNGMGGMNTIICNECQGKGINTETKMLGPMVQSWSSTCFNCSGMGYFIDSQSGCKECQGEGYLRERTIFTVTVKPGMRNNQKIVLKGEADQVMLVGKLNKEKVIPGDVIIVINQIEGKSWKNDSNIDQGENKNKFHFEIINEKDLLLRNCQIDLITSLCGGEIYIKNHPSGKLIKLDIIPSEILKPDCLKCVENLGMPRYIEDETNNGEEYLPNGDLYIQFKVKYPTKLENETIDKLRSILSEDIHMKNELQKEKVIIDQQLDDCIEVEEHVLSSFAPDLDRLRQAGIKSRSQRWQSDNTEDSCNKRQKRESQNDIMPDYIQDDLDTK
ncbi:Apj1p NDAI_0F02450 [Naumovozyma dairenensis CBS 421]|uniref:J domain-containing protein n=1 Tax=Naumovozyma dairenensis (strain ATCC 10597 / BCRC 20456 / CBS 421 / NBRC 0211 / NRRL Y-12639) TaxID=1071378 RepID=G0WCQ2_NAUDC|nr:hypothetical protein NDAI_0F02450 [Naumovozyma dairenensis CBS 421]CCD25563.1 hypothetical protein NDAI_0F02450 [Naumovozyma dairenensis CBS 421]